MINKKILCFICAVLFLKHAHPAISSNTPKEGQLQNTGISFTENKGQVYDQNYKARPDVLYTAIAGGMSLQIKQTGVSYQLYRVEKYKEVQDEKTKTARRQIGELSIYRVDMSWLHSNKNLKAASLDALPGYCNYYLTSCPNGALRVNSYKSVLLRGLYEGIDLHYYEKNSTLKYDYIVAPYANYKQIEVQVEGAKIKVGKDGSLILKTPFGEISEGAPLVFQNSRQLKAKWLIKGNILSFYIEDYDPAQELIIDPVTRAWGTYYGGNSDNASYCCVPDASGNVYITGETFSAGLFATSGAHQFTFGGGSTDAFLAKFDANGVRLWGTYYGGSDADRGYGCTVDVNNDVYMAGATSSTIAIASSGGHQTTLGGSNDAFLVKFDGNGIRQWGTYYGGISGEGANSCAADANGNIYVAGGAWTPNGTSIATPGSHQPTWGGLSDAFLVKFNSNGVRQWATYYGGIYDEQATSCAVDATGNIYISGTTESNSGTVIATTGAHQPGFGGNSDGFLAKFNSNGLRQWATYYGDYGYETAISCATDVLGNVFLAGTAGFSNGTVIATAGSHKPAPITMFYNDAYLVKFSGNGVRQWGTYYGGMGEERSYNTSTDANGNVYLAGITMFQSIGTDIATALCHQPVNAGDIDGFLVQFNSNGIRQWGTYYGGSHTDVPEYCAVDVSGNIYLTGVTSSSVGAGIATSGSHQSSFGTSSQLAFLAKFGPCTGPPAQPSSINGPTVVCAGDSTFYSTAPVPGVMSYSLWTQGNGLITSLGSTVLVTPLSSGIFTLAGSNGCGISPQQTLYVTVNPTPTVSVNSGTICKGTSFTLTPSGAITYSYSGGAIVSPTVTSFYSVTGANSFGCKDTDTSTVTVLPVPNIYVISNNPDLCVGESATITAHGATAYTFNPGGSGPFIVISPTVTSSYSVTATGTNGCSIVEIITQSVQNCSGLAEHGYDQGDMVFPNPAQQEITIHTHSDSEFQLLNALGQTIFSRKLFPGKNKIKLNELANGIYFVKIFNKSSLKTIKLVKE
ncbi:MAG: T9SS type A sorting domain-containing protein [Bacteroidia bacterium]|nr:T9SS type A sorting domain-containing protein [Bacteroidia bacterium]